MAAATRKLGVAYSAHTWAEKAHLPGYAADPRVDLVAVCDVVPEHRCMASQFGAHRIHTKPEELLSDPQVEMVDVCTPTDTH